MTAFAKIIQWFAMSKRMLLIVSPFLAIVAVLVWLAIISMDILAAGRAYVEGESLWSKNQKEAVFHLIRFATTGAESEFLSYQNAIRVPMGFRKARVELEKPHPDDATVRAGFIQGGTHPDDIPGVISLYKRFHRVSYMKNVLDIWKTGDEFMERLDAAAEELHTLQVSGGMDFPGRDTVLNRIIQINEELRPWQNRFSNTLGEALDPVHVVVGDPHGRGSSDSVRHFSYAAHGQSGRSRGTRTQGTQAGAGILGEACLPCQPRPTHQSG
jgi:hypothetical protein